MPEIYQPEEDSYLMSEKIAEEISNILSKNKNPIFLEIGCGSGINLRVALDSGIKKQNILGTDINEEAVRHCKSLGFNCILSDLFDKIKGKFDIIVFNPPYLPLDKNEPEESRQETTGGKKGNEIIIKFLNQAKKYLAKEGEILIITSSLSQDVDFKKLGYRAAELADKKLFFEKIIIWRLEI
ncbi:MAG: HemK2/MTQ2 family protein methyltransferase [Candidatus Pacearchaeota archaeon]|jgi:release factor glutamine methyltransferase